MKTQLILCLQSPVSWTNPQQVSRKQYIKRLETFTPILTFSASSPTLQFSAEMFVCIIDHSLFISVIVNKPGQAPYELVAWIEFCDRILLLYCGFLEISNLHQCKTSENPHSVWQLCLQRLP